EHSATSPPDLIPDPNPAQRAPARNAPARRFHRRSLALRSAAPKRARLRLHSSELLGSTAEAPLACLRHHFPRCSASTWSVWASQSLRVRSRLPDTIRLSSGEKATLVTESACPLRVSVSCPVCASHTFTVWSSLADTMRVPSAENATLKIGRVCPLSVSTSFPVCASHTFTSPGLWSAP